MRWLRWALWLAGLVLLGALALWLIGPREEVDLSGFDIVLPEDLDGYLRDRETAAGAAPGTEATILWAGSPGARTPLALVYLHGFSATRAELSPVAEEVAAALGANLYLARLAGHGLPGAAMAGPTATDWVRDAAEAVAIGRRLGERVVVIGTSTGATFAVLAAQAGEEADAYVLVSPNFRIRNRAAMLLTWPAARWWVPLVTGRERSWVPQTPDHARWWTERYPTVALLPMAAAVLAARAAPVERIRAPVLAVFRDGDQVVDPAATRVLLARWGGPVTILNPEPVAGDDPENHVIAGAILSPGATPEMIRALAGWIGGI